MSRFRRRVAVLVLALVPVVLAAGCGSSGPTADESASIPTSSPPASVLPTATTAPGSGPFASTCGPLTTALKVADLQPKDTGNWTLERQRIVTDADANAALYVAARSAAPADVATALGQLEKYALFLASAVRSATDFGSAVTAIGAYPDKVGASMAAATVDTWRRINCPS